MEKEKEKQNMEEEKSDEKFDDSESIPLADDDPSAIIDDESSRYVLIVIDFLSRLKCFFLLLMITLIID